MHQMKSEIRDGMRVDWDAPIAMDDGVVLRADVFRPVADGKYPVILSYGPYAKGLAFQEGYKSAWTRMTAAYPETAQGSSNKYQNWELVDPEKWVPDGYAIVRVDSRGAGRSPGYLDVWSPREAQDLHDCVEWAGTQPWSNGKVGINGISYYAMNQWHVGAAAAAASRRAVHLGRLRPTTTASCAATAASCAISWRTGTTRRCTSVQHGVGERGREERRHRRARWPDPRRCPSRSLTKNRADVAGEALRAPARSTTTTAPARRRLRARSTCRCCRRRTGAAKGCTRAAISKAISRAGSSRNGSRCTATRTSRTSTADYGAGAAAALLRPFPQRRGHRLGQAAEGRAQHPPARREVRAARRERMAARAHAMDKFYLQPDDRSLSPEPPKTASAR